MKIRIQAYKPRSISARTISRTLGVLLASERQVRKHGQFDHIINWGSSQRICEARYFNSPEAVRAACNKQTALAILAEAEVPTIDFTSSKDVATNWLAANGTVVSRALRSGNGGRGVVVHTADSETDLPTVPLYTLYKKKKDEYRVHVFRGEVIDVQQKRVRQDFPDPDFKIRSYSNGWVFCRDDVHCPASVTRASIAACDALGLDFGAVDVGYNAHYDVPAVYEVNTAPGIENSTIRLYRHHFLAAFPMLRSGRWAERRRNAA